MKVVAINGSPHAEGNTYHALRLVLAELEKEGIETEIIHIGDKPVRSCLGCGACSAECPQKIGIPEKLAEIREYFCK